MDAVVEFAQIETPGIRALDSAVGRDADAISRTRSVQAQVVLEAERALLDGDPAELTGMIVDRALRSRLPAKRDQLEEIVAKHEVARVPTRQPVQVGAQ